jgi:hypothetical protein
MLLTEFTSYAEVRAALGVSAAELPDATLATKVYLLDLKFALNEIGSTLVADFLALQEDPAPEAGSAEEAFVEATRLFATYCVAYHCVGALPIFSPKTITDGKAAQTRYSDAPYRDTVTKVTATFFRYRRLLASMYAVLKGTTAPAQAPVSLAVASSPTPDPVTGV